MKATQDTLLEAIDEYIDTDIMPHTTAMSKLEQFVFGMKVGIFRKSLPNKIEQILSRPEVRAMGIADDEGIAVDVLYETAKDTIEKIGFVEYNSLKFTVNDVDTLYRLIVKRGTQ